MRRHFICLLIISVIFSCSLISALNKTGNIIAFEIATTKHGSARVLGMVRGAKHETGLVNVRLGNKIEYDDINVLIVEKKRETKPLDSEVSASVALSVDEPDAAVIPNQQNPSPVIAEPSASLGTAIFTLINEYRGQNGLTALIWSDDLFYASSVRVAEICAYWSHIRPDGTDYYTVSPALVYGEILGRMRSHMTAVDLLRMWKESPTHDAVILDAELRTAAVSFMQNNDMVYIVMEFGL